MTKQAIKAVFAGLFIVLFSVQTNVSAQYADIDKAISQEEYQKALRLVTEKLASDPKNDGLYFRRGKAYLLIDEVGRAKEAFQKAINYGTKDPWNHIGLGSALASKQNFDGAKASLDKALELNRGDKTEIYIGIARAYLAGKNGKFLAEAETILYKVLAKEAKNKEALVGLGQMYFVQGINSLALSNFTEAVQVDDSYLQGWMKIGEVQMREKQWQPALDAFQKVEKLDPSYAPVKKWLGELEYLRGNYPKATGYYEKYVEATEGDLAAVMRYASFLYITEQCDKAVPIMEKVLQDTNSIVMLRLLGYCHCQMKNGEKSLEYFAKYFKTAKETNVLASDYENRGKAYQVAGKDSLAAIDYEKAVAMDSTKADLFRNLAQGFFKAKNYAKAGHYYKRFVQTGSPKFKDLFMWGNSYYFSKDYLNADTAFTMITEKYETVHIGHLYLGRVHTKLDSGNVIWAGKPHYEKVYELLNGSEELDARKSKDLAEACNYIGYYHYSNGENCKEAVPYYTQYLELEPMGNYAKGAQQVIDFCNKK